MSEINVGSGRVWGGPNQDRVSSFRCRGFVGLFRFRVTIGFLVSSVGLGMDRMVLIRSFGVWSVLLGVLRGVHQSKTGSNRI